MHMCLSSRMFFEMLFMIKMKKDLRSNIREMHKLWTMQIKKYPSLRSVLKMNTKLKNIYNISSKKEKVYKTICTFDPNFVKKL